MKKLIYVLIPFIIAGIFFIGIDKFLDFKNKELLETKDLESLKDGYKIDAKDKGVLLNQYLSTDDNIMLFGSSELANSLDQSPKNFFPRKEMDKDVVYVGRTFSQHLVQASTIGSMNKDISKGNYAIVVSMQWFDNKNGTYTNDFKSIFSPIQFYKYLNNPKITKEHKIKYAKRIVEILKNQEDSNAEVLYAKSFYEDGLKSKIVKTLLKPYYYMRYRILEVKDKAQLYKELIKLPEKGKSKPLKEINWEEENKKALEQAKKKGLNEKYGINQEYYLNSIAKIEN
ncbi:MAG: D-alanyl-lipoteichoic acid biosynthesis protein DltD, partial [Clostridium sp.]